MRESDHLVIRESFSEATLERKSNDPIPVNPRIFYPLIGVVLAILPGRAEDASTKWSEGTFFVEIVSLDAKRIEVTEPKSEEAENGRRSSGGKGRRSRNDGATVSVPVAEAVIVTTGTRERRTGDFQPGPELPGGVRNPLLAEAGPGSETRAARIRIKDGKVTELAILVADSETDEVIAVRPQRPPSE